MDVQLDVVTIRAKVLPVANSGGFRKHFSFRVDTWAVFRLDPYYDPKLMDYAQSVRTQFIKTRTGRIAPEAVDTGFRDDGYSAADGVWEDGGRKFWVNDTPGIDVDQGEQLDYTFSFQQTFTHRLFRHQVLMQTPVFQVRMTGTYPNIQVQLDPRLVVGWEGRRVVDLGPAEFRLDADF